MDLQPHQQRVIDEKAELDAKIERLSDFRRTPACAGLDESEQDRLWRQLGHMSAYSGVLEERIEAFTSGSSQKISLKGGNHG